MPTYHYVHYILTNMLPPYGATKSYPYDKPDLATEHFKRRIYRNGPPILPVMIHEPPLLSTISILPPHRTLR